ncbi:Ceramide very long chain fatty acid hydroxylase SCS7 [Choanephora cucurbitarum]|uniref:Ceramide very long chain fatty acid hydroxylase n=1 Tax=Choanephora cucurbitarum TaxID=101091 RepID=A0A1C7NN51_9FUNG|nr:Ceramide very long chain fatty acid hydroxylase SCS7 [Choanephora cucurbitarum]
MKTFSIKEVEDQSESLWIIFNNKVYDMTEFAKDHPGGSDIMKKYAGMDITEVMSDLDIHSHSSVAFNMMDDYFLGNLENETLTETTSRQLKGQRASLHRRRIGLLQKEAEYKTYTQQDFVPSVTDTRLDAKASMFLDLNKPLVPQMLTLRFTKEHYLEQVHKPRYLNRPADFFGHPLLEPLSKTLWWVVPLVWLPYIGYNLYRSLNYGKYGLHRFLFHLDDYLPENQFAFFLHFTLHGFHHYLPMDRLRLVVPPALLILLAYPWIMLAHILFPSMIAYAVVAGSMFGYVCYDLTHYYLHHATVISIHFAEMKKYHLAHHYKDFEAGYGITSKLWDYAFNTAITYT